MVTRLQRRHACAHLQHHARAFMAEDGREDAFRIGTRERVVIGMADAGGLDLDQHLAGARALQVDFFHGERGTGFPGDGGFGFHVDSFW